MIKIYKNGKTLKVTQSAFNNYYANSGWRLSEASPNFEDVKADKKTLKNAESNTNEVDVQDEWEGFDETADAEEEFEKPLSEMNRDELTAKAKSLGLNISNVNSNKQLRELIKSHM
jgi:hypothetical protein